MRDATESADRAAGDDMADGLADESAEQEFADDGFADESSVEDVGEDVGEEAPQATGHPAVDEVLRSLETLQDRPVDEHVGVFEQAHDQLRRTLQGAGDDE